MLGVFPCPILPGSGPPEPPLLSSPIRDLQLRLGQLLVGFIIAFWATPEMTTGHLLFAAVTTTWILFSIQLEERDLGEMLGQAYVEYRKRVPALIPFTRRGGSG